MSNLLVGCRAIYVEKGNDIEGVIVRVDRSKSGYNMIWILESNGNVSEQYLSSVKVHADDVKFLIRLSKSYKVREKMLTERTDRFEIMDL